MAQEIEIREAQSVKDLQYFVDMQRIEGWDLRIYEAESFFDADNHGFFIAFLKETNIPVGCISCVNYGDILGTIGSFIVEKPYRSKVLRTYLIYNRNGYLIRNRVMGENFLHVRWNI